jgi:uncharacterized protein
MTSLLSDIGPMLIVELLALGIVTGFLAGLLGVGGGMMMVPFLTFLLSQRGVEGGLAVKMAIATSMATILFTSLSSVRAHHARGAVRWDLARSFTPGLVLGSLLAGAGVFAVVQGRGLALFFALFIGWSALRMFRNRQPAPGRGLPGPAGQTAVGGGIGLASGLLGAGGAFLSVPFMIWCNVPVRHAVGTSAALGFPIALASVAGYLVSGWGLPAALPGSFGYLYLPALLIIALASVSLAPVGAWAAHRLDTGLLRRVFALLLMGLASYMLTRVWA